MDDIYNEVMLVVEPYRCMKALDDAALEKLRADAHAAFIGALRGRGIDASSYRLVVHIDELGVRPQP